MGVTLANAAGIVIAGFAMRERGEVHPRALIPVLLESTVWALLLAVTVGYVTSRLFSSMLPALQTGARTVGPIDAIVLSAAAGFHEELVFRVGLFAGGALLPTKVAKLPPPFAVGIAALNSLVFSAALHRPFGDSFLLVSFTFRALFGLALAGLYGARGFATVVYTYAICDVFVFTMLMFLHR